MYFSWSILTNRLLCLLLLLWLLWFWLFHLIILNFLSVTITWIMNPLLSLISTFLLSLILFMSLIMTLLLKFPPIARKMIIWLIFIIISLNYMFFMPLVSFAMHWNLYYLCLYWCNIIITMFMILCLRNKI